MPGKLVQAPVRLPLRAAWRDEPDDRRLWEIFPPHEDRCRACGYRLDAPGHANSMH